MTTVSRFSRQNDVGLRALNVDLWENLVLVVVLVLESKALYCIISTTWDERKMVASTQMFALKWRFAVFVAKAPNMVSRNALPCIWPTSIVPSLSPSLLKYVRPYVITKRTFRKYINTLSASKTISSHFVYYCITREENRFRICEQIKILPKSWLRRFFLLRCQATLKTPL